MYWIVHLRGGPRRVNHAAVAVGTKIFSFGGFCTGDAYDKIRPSDVHVLHTDTFRWKCLPFSDSQDMNKVPFQRYGHIVVNFGNNCYLWGGRNDLTSCDVLYCYNTETLQWSTPNVYGQQPNSRDGHSACVIDSCMYIFGGFEAIINQYTHDVYKLDLTTMHWTRIITQGIPPSWRDFHSATAINRRMYIYGGRSDVGGPYHTQSEIYDKIVMYLDVDTNRWHREATFNTPCGRRSHSAFVYMNKLYIIGGYNGDRGEHYGSIYCFDPEQNIWNVVKTKANCVCARRRQCAVLVGSRLFLFGGTSPDPRFVHSRGDIPEELIDHDDLHVLDLQPSLKTLSLMSVIKYGLPVDHVTSTLRFDIMMMTTDNTINRKVICNG